MSNTQPKAALIQAANKESASARLKRYIKEIVGEAVTSHSTPEDINQLSRVSAMFTLMASEYREYAGNIDLIFKRIDMKQYVAHRLPNEPTKARDYICKEALKEIAAIRKTIKQFNEDVDGNAFIVDTIENEYINIAINNAVEVFDSLITTPVNAPVNLTVALSSIMPGADKEQLKRYAIMLYKSAKLDIQLNEPTQ